MENQKASKFRVMNINKEWHLHHIMPKNPTTEQKIEWHSQHIIHCGCRDIPEKLKVEMRKRNINIPVYSKNKDSQNEKD